MAEKAIRGGMWTPWESKRTGKGPLGEKYGSHHNPKNKVTADFPRSYGTPRDYLKAHHAQPDNRTEVALIARRADRLAELYRKSSSDYRLQVPTQVRDPVKLRKALARDPLGTASKLERSLGIDLSQVKRMPHSEQGPYIVQQARHYLDHKIADAIANEKAASPVALKHGKMYDRTRHEPVGHYKAGPVHYAKLAAAVIGITFILLAGTSLLTGEISGAAITALDESPQFPFTLFFFITVVFLFGLLWQHANKPLEIK